MVIAGLLIGLSLIWLLSSIEGRGKIGEYVVATPENVFEHGRVWTLVTSPFLETSFISLLLQCMMLWMIVPTLERFWGTPRFYRFFAVTALVGTITGTLAGFALGQHYPIQGLSAFILAAIVAFGIIYARQPIQFFGVLPLTARQFMYGMLAFEVLFIVLQQLWALGAALAGAGLVAAMMTSKRMSPGLAWRRWRIGRARAKLSVIDGGKKPPRRDEHKWLN